MTPPLIEATTFGDLLVRAASSWPDREALVFPDTRLTFSELERRARRRARSLSAMGIGRGSYVGLLMPNTADMVELLLGCQLLGAIAVTVNSRYRSSELSYVVADSGVEVLVTTDVVAEHVDFVERLGEAIPGLANVDDPRALSLADYPKLRSVVCLGSGGPKQGMVGRDDFDALAETVDPEWVETARARVRVRDVALMIYTSGTTANPKGCPLGHEALTRTGMGKVRRFDMTDGDRVWDPLPMFHMSSIYPMTACLWSGATFISMTHFSVDDAIDQIVAERPTILFPSFPTLTASLLDHPGWVGVDVSAFRVVVNVAPPDTLRKFQSAYPDAVQVAAYGLSEACGVIAHNLPTEDLDTRVTTCGPVFSGVEVKVVDPDALVELPTGERGEIWVRGYSLFEGYHNDPEKTAESVTPDGWLRTGDLCSLDEAGRIRYHGRIKDMLKVGGENVAAVEIESHLSLHPAVKLAQVVGMPDPRLEEVPAAFVELAAGATATEAELIAFCEGRIASFKVPRRVVFVTEWPMSTTKIQKFRLKEILNAGEDGER